MTTTTIRQVFILLEADCVSALCSRGSLTTVSTGRQSQNGATWRQDLRLTTNSGFGGSAPRGNGYVKVMEGRERGGGFLPRLKGVGRIGKGPAPVPPGMTEAALGAAEEDVFLKKAKAEFDLIRKWLIQLMETLVRRSNAQVPKLELAEENPDRVEVSDSIANRLRTLEDDMIQHGSFLKQTITTMVFPPHPYAQEYEALELYRLLVLASIQFELKLFYPCEDGEEGDKIDSVVHGSDPHSLDVAFQRVHLSLMKLKQPKWPEEHGNSRTTYILTDNGHHLDYAATLGALFQDLRCIVRMTEGLAAESIQVGLK